MNIHKLVNKTTYGTLRKADFSHHEYKTLKHQGAIKIIEKTDEREGRFRLIHIELQPSFFEIIHRDRFLALKNVLQFQKTKSETH